MCATQSKRWWITVGEWIKYQNRCELLWSCSLTVYFLNWANIPSDCILRCKEQSVMLKISELSCILTQKLAVLSFETHDVRPCRVRVEPNWLTGFQVSFPLSNEPCYWEWMWNPKRDIQIIVWMYRQWSDGCHQYISVWRPRFWILSPQVNFFTWDSSGGGTPLAVVSKK